MTGVEQSIEEGGFDSYSRESDWNRLYNLASSFSFQLYICLNGQVILTSTKRGKSLRSDFSAKLKMLVFDEKKV